MRQRGRVFLLLGPSRRNALVVAGIELAGAALALAFARGEREGSA